MAYLDNLGSGLTSFLKGSDERERFRGRVSSLGLRDRLGE
jgi:hypothetical protein